MGDGGAIFTNIKYFRKFMQLEITVNKKYDHKFIGINSRLDTVNANFLIKKFSTFAI